MLRWLVLLALLSCAHQRGSSYRSPHDWVGTGGGFMYQELREGVTYYYRFEELAQELKLHLMLVNTTRRPIKFKAKDFYWLSLTGAHYPVEKLSWIKEASQRSRALPAAEKKLLLHEIDLVDRFMMDGEFQLEPDSPTKTYLLFPLPAERQFTLFLGPGSSGVKIARD